MLRSRTELIIALTSQIGTDLGPVQEALKNYLETDYEYRVEKIHVSDFLQDMRLQTEISEESRSKHYSTRMHAGSEARPSVPTWVRHLHDRQLV